MKGKRVGILIGVAAVVVAVGASVTVTQQNEYKLIRQFGKVDRVISSSGISFKIPFIESTQSLPKETLLYDLAAVSYTHLKPHVSYSQYITVGREPGELKHLSTRRKRKEPEVLRTSETSTPLVSVKTELTQPDVPNGRCAAGNEDCD